MEKATFGAGCFWGVEAAFQNVDGVISTSVGYMGGTTKNPTYEDVCTHTTGHAEVVQIIYDPSIISYNDLLEIFWNIHDPTSTNRQGSDIGDQYRSVIFYHTPQQKNEAIESMKRLQESSKFPKPIVTQLSPASEYYIAEDYHQRYLEKRKKRSCSI